MVKTKKSNKKSYNKTKKKRLKSPYFSGFVDTKPKINKDLWNVDFFGYRKSASIDKYKIIKSLDNQNLATDYKTNPKIYKQAKEELSRRLILQLKNKSSRKLFKKYTKKYGQKSFRKIIEKLPINKLQKIHFLLLKKENPIKLRKK
tara:strand:+ start:1627 stop:2064 length:438 start_codon:yes stop_codon:yes gene_type:complete